MVINQEELKVTRLTYSTLIEDEHNTVCKHVNFLIEVYSKLIVEKREDMDEAEALVDNFQDTCDGLAVDDKVIDRGFKREFSDQPASVIEQLYKLFKKRPKMGRPPQLTTASFYKPSIKPPVFVLPDSDQVFKELDSNIPDGVDLDLWKRLCAVRRSKIESEVKIKQASMTLVEMKFFLNTKKVEMEQVQETMDQLLLLRNQLIDEKLKESLNLNVQFLLKQGQVEIECGVFIPKFEESVMLQREVIEQLNKNIKKLGNTKVAKMIEIKEFKKGIHQLEWEKKMMIMQMEDLQTRSKYIQLLKLTKNLQDFLQEDDYTGKQHEYLQSLEVTYDYNEKEKQKRIKFLQEAAEELNKTIRCKKNENLELDKIVNELIVQVSERQNINSTNVELQDKSIGTNKRMKIIAQRRRLVDMAKAQAQEIAVLRAEVERLRMKTFPALVQLD